MTDRDAFYLTTAIFYPSERPALHSMFEAIGADMIARYHRLLGEDVRFLSGLDEHGLTPETATIYLCGNPEMITAVDEIATIRGFPPEQVRKELYWPKGREH